MLVVSKKQQVDPEVQQVRDLAKGACSTPGVDGNCQLPELQVAAR
jgi:hypothetical protein